MSRDGRTGEGMGDGERDAAAGTPDPRDGSMPDAATRARILQAFGTIGPDTVCIMTAKHEDSRAGMRVLTVQQCAEEPILVCVAARKGHFIEPLMRDSHHFGLCVVGADDRLPLRKFPEDPEDATEDPFDAFPTLTLASGSPLLKRGRAVLDCEVVRHFDLEADHEIYVGLVLDAKVLGADG
jgi:flavin reductase (DIM6/NTAB) family NADH-FMN oxidoreductase RutF